MSLGAAVAPPSNPASRLLPLSIFFAALAGGAAVTNAQSIAPAQAAPVYVDRVLETGPQQETEADQAVADNLQGWARGMRVEYALASQRGQSSSLDRGLAFTGFLDTPNYGALSLSGNVTHSSIDGPIGIRSPLTSSGTWRVDQRAMPLNAGWIGNHSAGDTNTIMPGISRGFGRLFLPTSPISGVAGQWSLGDRVELNAASGTPGLFSGFDINGFARAPGRISSGGAQFELPISPGRGSRMDAAIQVMQARDIADAAFPGGIETRSSWSSLVWQGQAPWASGLGGNAADRTELRTGGLRLQGNWLHSTSTGSAAADGTWLDGAWRTGTFQNAAGAFRFDPNVRWGTSVTASDLQGLYWRATTASRQWELGWNVELDRSVSGLSGSSSFGDVSGRYRLDSRNALGATLAMRRGDGAAQSVQLSWDRNSGVGQTQWRASALRSPAIRTNFLGIDHSWKSQPPMTFATSLGVEQSHGEFASSSVWTWGILSGFSPAAGVAVDASLRGARGNAAQSLNVSLGAVWTLRRNWSLSLRYNESRGQDPQLTQVVSALTAALQAPNAPVPPLRSLQLVLRYELRAGSVSAPLGGTPGSGAGRLEGTVFLDANENNRRDASEAGVPNVSVILDRRYVARTDAQGRYEFPFVVAGEHQLQIQSDNVPLPWMPVERESVPVTVPLRGLATHDFSVQRER